MEITRDDVLEFIQFLDLTDEEVLKALLSAFASVQPGPIRQSWLRSRDYGVAPSTETIWNVLVDGGFRCSKCQTHLDITIDHRDRDTGNVDVSNFRVLCRSCNRAANSRGLENRDAHVRIYRAFMSLYKATGDIPSAKQVCKAAGLPQLSGGVYLVKLLQFKLGRMPVTRHFSKLSKDYGRLS